MYNRPEQILEQYELNVKAVSRGRDCYLIDTNLGVKSLSEYRGSKERAGFLKEMLDFLQDRNLLVENIVYTKEGEPLVVDDDGSKQILLDTFSGAECDAKNRDDMILAVKTLAGLHNASNEFQGEVPEFVKMGRDSLLLLYEKHNRELRQVRNYIRSRRKKNEFEEMFGRHYERFMKKASDVTDLLGKMELENVDVGFCHGDFNQHNVIFLRQGIALVGFEHFSYNMQISDLANFVRKMMEKNNWNTGLGMDFIQAYHNERKLSELELKYLYLYLAYPEKFWKIANRYNNSHKAWLSGRNIEKLEKVIAQEEEREQFLEMLFHFVR